VVDQLPGKHEALSSNFIIIKKKIERKEKRKKIGAYYK
jgi:hypothetical protein